MQTLLAELRPASLDGAGLAPALQEICADAYAGSLRDMVIQALSAQLARRRLLTILGSGGIGKTTTALAIVEAVRAGRSRTLVLRGEPGIGKPGNREQGTGNKQFPVRQCFTLLITMTEKVDDLNQRVVRAWPEPANEASFRSERWRETVCCWN